MASALSRLSRVLGLPTPAASTAPASSVPATISTKVQDPPAPEAKGVTFVGDTRRYTYILNGIPIGAEADNPADYVRGIAAYQTAALAYICIRYRAMKVREAPLMVVTEDQDGEQWIKGHQLEPLLRRPNADYGMRRLIEATETFLCLTGGCIWVKNYQRNGEVGSLYPFSKDEYEVESDSTRLFARYKVNNQWIDASRIVPFGYFHPGNTLGNMAPLDAALTHLQIGGELAHRVRNHVRNAMMPGGIYVADKDWHSTDEEFDRLKLELNTMFQAVNSGKTAVAEGGGKLERGFTLQELSLGELWREVEATVCGVFNVPASLVGTVVGLENSPWSHLATAKQSFYDECVLPEWADIEEAITEHLLREVDPDPAHLIRFDKSRIRPLQKDLALQSTIAVASARILSLNERRLLMGYPKSPDPRADEIPELAAPLTPVGNPANNPANDPAADKAGRRAVERKFATLRLAYTDAITEQHSAALELTAGARLATDAEHLAAIARRELGKQAKEAAPSERARERARIEMEAYLDGASGESWAKYTTPLLRAAAEDALVATVIPDLNLDAALLRPHIGSFIQRESSFLITNVTDTTKQAVRDALARTIDDGIDATVKAIREDAAFSRARARLIGRTETTRVLNGAPLEALQQYGATTDQRFTKSWLATLDDRVRDEHAALHGETVPIDSNFSNGLPAPGEPNCRCGLTYGVEGVSQ